MQTLQIFQSLWGMEQRIPEKSEPPYDTQFEQIANAGYHGVCLDPAIHEIKENLALAPLFDQFKLECMVNVFPYKIDELRPLLDMSLELNAVQVNIIGGVMPIKTTGIKEVVESWKEISLEQSPPSLLCSSTVDFPPLIALLTFFDIDSIESVMKIVVSGFEEDILPPVIPGANL